MEGLHNVVHFFQLTSHTPSNLPFELKGVICSVQSETQDGFVPISNGQMPNNNKHLGKPKGQDESPEDREVRLAERREKRHNESTEQREAQLAR